MGRLKMLAAAGDASEASAGLMGRDPPELNQLAGAALGNDPAAVRQFLAAISPIVRRVCLGVLGREHADLEDTIQESLVATLDALPDYRFEGPIAHYVTKISLRLAIAVRRRVATRSGRLRRLEEPGDPGAVLAADGHRIEEAQLVRKVLGELKRVQAEALVLHLALGFSIDEISTMTGVRLNTVKTRVRRGKAFLVRALERMGLGRGKSHGKNRGVAR